MKPIVSAPVNGYLFWIRRTAALKHAIGQYGRFFSAVQGTQAEGMSKAGPNSKTQRNIGKKFLSTANNPNILMDFEVWSVPKLFHTIRGIFNYLLVLQELDSFSLPEFRVCSGKALHVVVNLLSELRFSELDGLLTPECKEEVERNLRKWKKSCISHLAFKPEQLSSSVPCDCCIVEGGRNNEKLYVEVRVIHYVWLQFSSEFIGSGDLDAGFEKEFIQKLEKRFGNTYMCTVFNSKFIKEITKGTNDQWIINAINLKINYNVLSKSVLK